MLPDTPQRYSLYPKDLYQEMNMKIFPFFRISQFCPTGPRRILQGRCYLDSCQEKNSFSMVITTNFQIISILGKNYGKDK